ncbi:nidogen-1-like [Parambassis ranga]|uniref:Nidogen-1-like n=1 Tax=Parambassis ranga TaxID=210632 RepID=A0A6P7J6L0_9TELE|nr:nidogen-1-like [Parambassis ranga]
MGPWFRSSLWVWSCMLSLSVWTRALEFEELFEFGEEAGDHELQPGSDATAELYLNQSLLFFSEAFDKVYINTNGFVSFVNPPAENEYLGDMPSSFKMIAALLGDLDNSDGQGKVYFREDNSPNILSRTAEHILQAFPRDTGVEPKNTLIVTWENIAANGMPGQVATKRNTFQLVVASLESSSCAILLYPRDGLQFLYTQVKGASKLLEVGFNEGLVAGWFWNTKQGTYFQATTTEETSIRELTKKTNSARNGVWVYEIGASPFFSAITPGMVTSSPEDEEATEPPVTMLPRQPDEQQEVDFSIFQTQTIKSEAIPEETPTEIPSEYQTSYPQAETEEPEYEEEEYPDETLTPTPPSPESTQRARYPEVPEPRYPDQSEPRYPTLENVQPRYTIPEPSEPRYSPVEPRYPEHEPVQPVPPHSRSQHPQIVVVDEDEILDEFEYHLETCAHSRQKCSPFADCRDYSNGYCCHCRPGFYGNGKDCVAEGKPQRMNGKVNGRVFVGNMPSPVELNNNDLHSYVVANDGRAYVAISNIPDSVGPSLQPLSSLGGIIGWAFALEQPGFQNGFSLIGGQFFRQAEVIFQPGNERLSIKQQFKGIDEHDHLVVSTELEGRLPAIQLGSSVQISPYKEIYQYGRNLITSSSNREYTITTPGGSVQIRSYQWRQTITYQGCAHDDSTREALPPQQLSVDQIFVMFDTGNHLIRFAMSNKIGSIHSSVLEQNPCHTGRHGCDINAVCRPGEALHFTCECTTGFAGDGRYCQDIDECRENPQVCGPSAVCNNQPGTFRCECFTGFTFASDGRTCIEENRPVDHCQRGSHDCDVPERAMCSYTGGSAYGCSCLPGFVGDGRLCQDVDECQQELCHRDAVCSNTQGSYTCQCHSGFYGDGFQCTPVSSEREKTQCERHRESAQAATTSSTGFFSFFRPRPAVGQYIPQCNEYGAYEPTQCHTSIGQCWCVDANGQEIPNTRTGPGSTPLCIDQSVTPSPVGPTPRPDVHPVAPGTHLLFAQSGRIEHMLLDGYSMNKEEAKPLLHIPDRVAIAVAYDCVEKMVYWSDITGPEISKASLSGGDIIPVITKELQSPEGIAIDHVSRLLFWTDSMRDTIEVSKLDGSQRRVLFDTDLVNPRPIVTNPAYGRLYWADWNRDGPKIEMSNMDGTERVVLVKDDLGLPNGLTFDPENQQLCWADAGTHKVECMDPHRQLRKQIVEGIQYPFALVSFGRNLYYTDWRREAVVAVDRHSEKETEEFLPQRRSRPYGITTTPTQCPQAYNYCSNNGGCSHLCLPRLGGFTCRCPDAAEGQCVERNL